MSIHNSHTFPVQTMEENILEREKERLVDSFRMDEPEIYALYESIFHAMASVPPVVVQVSIRGDGTGGESK